MPKITHTEIRMYKMGTGDCFTIKFFAGKTTVFKIMIDAGTWSGSGERLAPYIKDLDYYADVLIVTHEHMDHVHAFDVYEDLFLGKKLEADGSTDKALEVGEVWMGWTEADGTGKVKN